MSFYSSASFFIPLAVLAVPAAVLGLAGRRIKHYGMVASLLMLALLFSSSLRSLAAFGLFVAVACTGAFATLRSFAKGKGSLALYRVSLAATLAPLVIYKVTAATGPHALLGFIGISYLTFKAVQVLIEIRDGLIKEMTVADYLYFLTFFATITSGPIDRSRRFIDDANERIEPAAYRDLLCRGVLLLLVGAVMQLVLATMLRWFSTSTDLGGTWILPNLVDLQVPQGVRGVIRAYAYGLYLFFDFAGYSCMAVGASYLFGIRTPRNFRAPFAAVDVKDFWNRWHMTLSTWLRDFVFMRFTRWATKRRLFSDRLQTACAGYLVNMVLMGAWHGLTIDYLAYGAYHGVLLAATEVYQKKCPFYKRHKGELWYRALSWFITLNLVMVGFALFSGQVHSLVGRIIHG